ncbi:MAG: hypothetical protein JWO05_2470 [Gemmatimonadetes bacterium]|nr:hypothetical protein [Gemmatimonadota bacterium]
MITRALILAAMLGTSAAAQVSRAEYQQRRDAFVAKLPDPSVTVVLGAPEPPHDYEAFVQSPQLYFLTGLRSEADAALVFSKQGGQVRQLLFVIARDPARETWTGTRLGADRVEAATGVAGRDRSALDVTLDSLLQASVPLLIAGEMSGSAPVKSADQQFADAVVSRHAGLVVRSANAMLGALRSAHSPAELALLRKSIDITVRAQREAMAAIEPGMNEFELQALIEYTFRRNGADRPSFSTIVGSGPNGTTLHYNTDDRVIGRNDLVVMDIGASYQGYAADVTRTVPASGTYSPLQRALYEIVRATQAAAEAQAKPGAQWRTVDSAATATLSAGLTRLGLIESPTATYECAPQRQCRQSRLFYMHGLGHGIGLEVHDPNPWTSDGRINLGSAFTIEPGIYVRADALDYLPDTPANRSLRAKLAPAVNRYRDMGVRIEDDYAITAQGAEWLSKAPREMAEIEALMRQPFTGPAKRDAALVRSYPPEH